MHYKESIRTYAKSIKWSLLATTVFFLGFYSSWIFHTNPKIDTVYLVNDPNSIYNWTEIGRQGLLFTEMLFGVTAFKPWVYTFFGYIFIALGAHVFGYFFWTAERKSALPFSLFLLMAFFHPILAEQFYFDLQIFQVGFAYVVTAIACCLSDYAVRNNKIPLALISVLLLVWSFSSYQPFMLIYIAAIVCRYILCLRSELSQNTSEINWLKTIISHMLIFIVAFSANTIITKLWFSASDYLDSQVNWGKLPYDQVLASLGEAVVSMLTKNTTFYDISYIVIAFTVLIVCIFDISHSEASVGNKALYLIAVAGLQIVPFLLALYIGGAPVVRSMLVYPFIMGIDVLLLVTRRYRFSPCFILALIFCAIPLWLHANKTLQLLYTDAIRAKDDVCLASQLNLEISGLSKDKPVAFVGNYTPHLNNACLTGTEWYEYGPIIGISMFEHCRDLEPRYQKSTIAGLEAMSTLGYSFAAVSPEQMLDARKAALSMNIWPAEGSVKEFDDYIVVKLGEDTWTQDLGLQENG